MPGEVSVVEEIKAKINDTNSREAYESVKETLRQRLQERVLEMIDLPRGEVDLELDELMQIAERFGFKDEREILERYSFETLRDFTRFKRKKRNRSEKERRLEDFLSSAICFPSSFIGY